MFRTVRNDHYYEVRLNPYERESLIELLEGGSVSESRRAVLVQKLKAAEQFDCLPFRVNWEHYEDAAKERGSSLADWIWDAGSRGATK